MTAVMTMSITIKKPQNGRTTAQQSLNCARWNRLDRRRTRALSPAVPLFREARYLLAEDPAIGDLGLYHSVLSAIAYDETTSAKAELKGTVQVHFIIGTPQPIRPPGLLSGPVCTTTAWGRILLTTAPPIVQAFAGEGLKLCSPLPSDMQLISPSISPRGTQ